MAIHLFRPKIYSDEIILQLKKIMDSGWIGLGPVNNQFENEFSKYVNCKYSVSFNSATSALHLAMKMAAVSGGNVISTPLTFVSTNAAIKYENATINYCDIDSETLHIDVNEIKKNINCDTKAIVVVHYGGLPIIMDEIYDIAASKNIWVIEDAAHACGARYIDGTIVGSSSYDKCITTFSFHAVKNLPIGDGGMITTNNESVADKLRTLRWMGIDKSTFIRSVTESNGYNWMYDIKEIGYKYHMTDMDAAIGLVGLSHLDEGNARRKDIFNVYKKNLARQLLDGIVGDVNDNRVSAHHNIVIKVDRRDELIAHLNKNDIYPGVHYYPNHLYEPYATGQKLPVAETVWKKIVTLPMHLYLTDEQVINICDIINEFLSR